MGLLVLENAGSVAHPLAEALRSRGYRVHAAYDILDAKTFLENEEISGIIADLNMPADGLSESQIDQTQLGIVTAWIWLRDEVFPNHPDLRSRTILYSEYLDEFRQLLPNANTEGVVQIAKRGTGGVRELLGQVERIMSAARGN